MPTGQAIITQSLVDLGVYSPGETPSASESANGLTKLNMMLDAMSGARDLIYEIALASYALTANTQSYPIGPTGTAPFNVARPIKVETAAILLSSGSGRVVRIPMRIISQAEWEDLPDRANATGVVPLNLYIDPQVPNAVLNFNPIPLVGADNTSVELGTWTAIGQFATLATNANLPPTYLRLLVLGLEVELAPTYGQVNPAIVQQRVQQFTESLAVVRALNSAVQMMPLAPVQSQQAGQSQNPQLAAQLLGR